MLTKKDLLRFWGNKYIISEETHRQRCGFEVFDDEMLIDAANKIFYVPKEGKAEDDSITYSFATICPKCRELISANGVLANNGGSLVAGYLAGREEEIFGNLENRDERAKKFYLMISETILSSHPQFQNNGVLNKYQKEIVTKKIEAKHKSQLNNAIKDETPIF